MADKKHRVVILGAGWAGRTVARELSTAVDNGAQLEITLIDRGLSGVIGALNPLLAMGRVKVDDFVDSARTIAAAARNVACVWDEVERIDAEGKTVRTGSGAQYAYDDLVVALGAERHPERLAGLAEHAHLMTSAEDSLRLRERLLQLGGGDVLVMISSLPHPCPPIGHEFAFAVHEVLRERGVQDKVRVVFTSPYPTAVPAASPEAVQAQSDAAKIETRYGWQPAAVREGEVEYKNGETIRYDVLVAFPPCAGPAALRGVPLVSCEDGWGIVDGRTLRAAADGVYVIGDAATPEFVFAKAGSQRHPKAGKFAVQHAHYVARVIAAEAGKPRVWSAGPPSLREDGTEQCMFIAPDESLIAIDVNWFVSPDKPHFAANVVAPGGSASDAKLEWINGMRAELSYRS